MTAAVSAVTFIMAPVDILYRLKDTYFGHHGKFRIHWLGLPGSVFVKNPIHVSPRFAID